MGALADISLLEFARSKGANTVGTIAQKMGVKWPPPPTISVRNLVLVGSRVIVHLFVLMLENRSFDHMLGFSAISGTDAVSGAPTTVNGLTGAEANSFNGHNYAVQQPAHYAMPVDPAHEFPDAVVQLCGPGVNYPFGGAYPPIVNSGFVASYAAAGGSGNLAEIMKCYGPGQLPVLNQLAQEFVVCDNWYAAMPGPTWPNRFFAHGASSGGLDHSPSTAEILQWETVDGFSFKNGTIFDRMNANNFKWRLYAGDDFPTVAGLKGIQLTQVLPYHQFLQDVSQPDYPAAYTFIEPSYNVLSDYRCSTSQHPLDDVTRGESLIKFTYEAVRNSPIWNSSLLIITWDEHGGFYDHVAPPGAVAPGDTVPGGAHNQYGFTFEQYGPRVAAVVVSPRIPRNLIDHRVYDHSAIPATLERFLGLAPMTQRDAGANDLSRLVLLSNPRGDAPAELPAPVDSGVGGCNPVSFAPVEAAVREPQPISRPEEPINEGNLPGILHAALRGDLELSPPERRQAILARFAALRTRADAMQYLDEVRQKVRAAKSAPSRRPDLR
jgi:phospholipase C